MIDRGRLHTRYKSRNTDAPMRNHHYPGRGTGASRAILPDWCGHKEWKHIIMDTAFTAANSSSFPIPSRPIRVNAPRRMTLSSHSSGLIDGYIYTTILWWLSRKTQRSRNFERICRDASWFFSSKQNLIAWNGNNYFTIAPDFKRILIKLFKLIKLFFYKLFYLKFLSTHNDCAKIRARIESRGLKSILSTCQYCERKKITQR